MLLLDAITVYDQQTTIYSGTYPLLDCSQYEDALNLSKICIRSVNSELVAVWSFGYYFLLFFLSSFFPFFCKMPEDGKMEETTREVVKEEEENDREKPEEV